MYSYLANKSWHKLDFAIILVLIIFGVFSINIIQSATGSSTESGFSFFASRQIMWLAISSVVLIITTLISHKHYKFFAPYLYTLGLLLLAWVEFFGYASGGSQRWIDLGFFRVQPSEFMKLFMILLMAKVLAVHGGTIDRFRDVLLPIGIMAVPFVLVLMEPDLGTALVFAFITLCMFIAAGVNWRILLVLFIIVLVLLLTLVFLFYFQEEIFFKIIKEYQLNRIISFVNPEADPLRGGFQVTQSLIAIGSGQLTGKGLNSGTQTQGGWVPEHHTDFIFAVIGEETGFFGVSFLIILFFFLIYRILLIAGDSNDLFGSFVAVGVIGMLVFQVFQNIGMTVGLMPITGLALPLISYGGSSTLATYISLGIVLSISICEKPSMFGN